jgi:hypothetical protein
MWQDSQTETQDTEAVQQEATFYCASTDSVDSCPKAELRGQRGFTLYALASRLQKEEARFNPFMIACNSIGDFTPPPPVLYDLLPVQILYIFISLLCHHHPLVHFQNTDLFASFLALFPATSFPSLMFRPT